MLGTGGVGLYGGTAAWMDNNEPRFAILQDQINDLKVLMAGKVDTTTRIDMKRELEERISAVNQRVIEAAAERQRQLADIQRHLEYLDRRLDSMQEQRGQYRQTP